MTDNMRIWSAMEKTDPDATKGFNRGGGFRGTATNPTYLAERATALFGPYGIGWGMDLLSSDFRDGHIFDELGNREVIHIELWKLWYEIDGKRGEVSHYGQTTFVGKNKYGAFTDEEAPKKTKTDAMTKCLALLGFAADIHRGRFDDVKYVNDRRREEAEAKKSSQPGQTDDEVNAKRRDWLSATMAKAVDRAQLKHFREKQDVSAAWDGLPDAMRARLDAEYNDLWNRLQEAA